MEAPLLTVTGVSKSFKGVHALQGIDLELAPGEIHCLAGENGSGKSTLIKVISGVHAPDSGSITINGTTWDRLTPLEAIAAGVQVIYQDFSVFPNLSVMENLALTTEVAAGRKLVNWKRFRAIAERAVATIGFKVDLDAKVGDLSVADKQLVAICRALISDAKLIIMDEPTTALTKNEVAALFRIILDLRSRGIAILFVSHKLEEVFEIAERFTVLRNGQKIITCPKEDLDRRSFAKYMTGKEFDETRFEPTALSDEPVLEVAGLSASGAFEDVSFELRRGEILGITGLLGSGRTELALALFGAHPTQAGTIRVQGAEVRLRSVNDAIDAGIAYVPEDRLTEGLFLSRSIGENIVISELSDFTNALGKWLATKPDVLILNGPTVGVDIGSKFTIHSILRELAADGMAVIIISDDISEVLTNCSRVLIMRGGQLREAVDPATTSEARLGELLAATDSQPGSSGPAGDAGADQAEGGR